MKSIIIGLLGMILLIGCNSSTETNSEEKAQTPAKNDGLTIFERYVGSLEKIPLPFTHNPMEDLPKLSTSYDSVAFSTYRSRQAVAPLGILFQTERAVGIIDYGWGDLGQVPYLTTYALSGKKLGSISFYEKTGSDMGYEAMEYVSIQPDLSIMITNTIKSWDLNKKKTDIVKKSMTLTEDTIRYQITTAGKIEKQ